MGEDGTYSGLHSDYVKIEYLTNLRAPNVECRIRSDLEAMSDPVAGRLWNKVLSQPAAQKGRTGNPYMRDIE